MQQYQVEDIIAQAYVQDNPFYKVKWKGYSTEEATWEHQKNLSNLKSHIKKYSIQKNPLSQFIKMIKFDTLDELYEYDKQLQQTQFAQRKDDDNKIMTEKESDCKKQVPLSFNSQKVGLKKAAKGAQKTQVQPSSKKSSTPRNQSELKDGEKDSNDEQLTNKQVKNEEEEKPIHEQTNSSQGIGTGLDQTYNAFKRKLKKLLQRSRSKSIQKKKKQQQNLETKPTSVVNNSKQDVLGESSLKEQKEPSLKEQNDPSLKEQNERSLKEQNETNIKEQNEMQIMESQTIKFDNDRIIQILNVFPAFLPKEGKVEVIAKVRKQENINKIFILRFSQNEGKAIDQLIKAEDLKYSNESQILLVDYFLRNLQLRGKPIIIDTKENILYK